MASPPSEPTNDNTPPVVTFRSSKKRKANYRRQRTEDEEERPEEASASNAPVESPKENVKSPVADAVPAAQTVDELIASATAPSEGPEVKDDEHSIAEALRLRAQRRSRLNGVGFKASQSGVRETNDERGIVLHSAAKEDGHDALAGAPSRFAPQTGLSTQLVNKHMMEYIESKISSRKAAPPAAADEPKSGTQNAAPPTTSAAAAPNQPAALAPGSATLQGKLMEIDLGEESRARNIALTERARRRLLADDPSGPTTPGSATTDAEDDNLDGSDAGRAKKKPRLGRDGKPWRPRNRRTSDDIARDKLVEEILHESRLDVYDPPPAPTETTTDGTADDRLADEFRRDFLDAMAQRRQQQAAAAAQRKRAAATAPSGSGPPRPGAAGDDDVLRGPKLGGSRSQRAAMRDILLAKEREKEKAARRGR